MFAFCPVLVACLLFAGVALAFEETDFAKVKEFYNCPGCDLSQADLTGVNLACADLRETNLSGANLSGVQLGQAKLSGANLSGADLAGAKLYMTDLKGANLSGARLSGAKLYNAVLEGADLKGADLSDALWTDGKKCKAGSLGECVR